MSPVGPELGFGSQQRSRRRRTSSSIETARGVLKFGFGAIHIKIYKGDSNAAGRSAGNPADQVFAEELEAPGGPEDGYSTGSSLSREMRALGPPIEDVHLSGTEVADVTVVEVAAVDVTKTSTNNLHHSKAASAARLLRLTEAGVDLVLVQEPWVVGGKVAGLGTKEYKLLLDPTEGKIRTCILAKRHLSTFLLRNYSNGDNTAVEEQVDTLSEENNLDQSTEMEGAAGGDSLPLEPPKGRSSMLPQF